MEREMCLHLEWELTVNAQRRGAQRSLNHRDQFDRGWWDRLHGRRLYRYYAHHGAK